MNALGRIAGFLAILAVVFVAAVGAGNAVDPIEQAQPQAHGEEHAGSDATSHGEQLPGGLMVSQSGFTLEAPARAEAGRQVPVEFRITGADGHALTAYDVEHEKRLHLIAVRRDFSGFQHVHPRLDADGTWHTSLDLAPGQWRLFADFAPTGAEGLTLGSDLLVAGSPDPAPEAEESRTATVDGYTVTLDGELRPGEDSRLTLAVTKDGAPVDVEPYLGASGHLVALREGDLAYLHVHPETTEDLVFVAAVPSAGRYHLYLDFQHEGVVRTATFTVGAGGGRDDDH